MRLAERVVRLAKHQRGKQLFAIAISREGARLTDQAPDDVAVVDPMPRGAPQPRHGLDELATIADVHARRMLPRLDRVPAQPRRHRVGPPAHADGAPATHHARERRVIGHRGQRQRTQIWPLRRQAGRCRRIPPPFHHVADEGFIRGFIDDTVFVGFARLDPGGAQPVMLKHTPEPRGELPPATALQLMRRCRQIVVPDDGRHRAERPQGPLQPGDERLKGLACRQRHVGPPAETQHPLEQQMREGDAVNRDAQVARVREIEGALTARDRDLLKVHLHVRAMLRTPVAYPALEGPQLPRLKAAGIPSAEPLEQRQRLQPPLLVGDQPRHDLRGPDVHERVGAGPPPPPLLRRRRQWPVLPPPRRPLTHARRRGGRLQRLAVHPLLPQPPYLGIRDQTALPSQGKWTVSHARSAVGGPAILIVVGRQF